MTIMNQGTVASQRALETTLVRQAIDAQADTLRFLHDAYVAKFQPNATYDPATPAGQWALMSSKLTARSASSSANITTCPSLAAATIPPDSFIMDSANAKFITGTTAVLVPATTYAQVAYDAGSGGLKQSQGIWIEGIKSEVSADANRKNTRYIDFHIRACWDNPGQGPPMTIGTIVRLYEPQS
jgi:hypothetical protein